MFLNYNHVFFNIKETYLYVSMLSSYFSFSLLKDNVSMFFYDKNNVEYYHSILVFFFLVLFLLSIIGCIFSLIEHNRLTITKNSILSIKEKIYNVPNLLLLSKKALIEVNLISNGAYDISQRKLFYQNSNFGNNNKTLEIKDLNIVLLNKKNKPIDYEVTLHSKNCLRFEIKHFLDRFRINKISITSNLKNDELINVFIYSI